ncbi:MAG: TonB-dependent receptor [Proteobacteria bacterium]|nr:TonB-dependent receptor [Pseudomonadota bacterium]
MNSTHRRVAIAALFTTTALISTPVLAQDAAPAASNVDPTEIVVTAQKRSESLQNVPISIQALGTQKLDQLNISDFKGYAQQLPSVSFQTSGTPGVSVIYMRGVASGGDGNHSGPLPSVGVYLDEQPVTTIGGNLDVHIYDIARIESLSGPQGTLYGASSEAGTIRIITNKPSTAGFEGRVDGEVNHVEKGGWGGKLEGMINAPISSMMALRVVGWYEKDAGYIDNVAGCRSFLPETNAQGCPPAKNGGIALSNAAYVKKNYNDTEIAGGRAALKVDLNESWVVTPSVTYQDTRSHGSYGYDAKVGDLQVQHFAPEYRRDKFVQAGLTIEGKLGNWDLTYAGAYLDRKTFSSSDYIDYSEAYDSMYSYYGGLAGYFYFNDATGNKISPVQKVIGSDHFKKFSQELRIASPSADPVRVVAGAFYQYQSNDIHQDYQVANLAPNLSVNGMPGTLWLTQQHRIDKDYAMFGEMAFDVSDKLTLTGGARAFFYDNSLIGFFGFGRDPANNYASTPHNAAGSSRTGVAGCFTTTGDRVRTLSGTPMTLIAPIIPGSPCTNLGVYVSGIGIEPVKAKGSGVTYRLNATWKPAPGLLLYATASKGYRPGGINRRADVGPYQSDYLYNYEIGWKTTLTQGLRFNGAIYHQDWKKFQFAYLGANSFTEIHNGPSARVNGVEADLTYNREGMTLNLAGAYTDAKTTKNLCIIDDPTYQCTGTGNIVSAAKGTRLPITPIWKLSGTARYTFGTGTMKPYLQANASYQSSASTDLRTAIFRTIPPNTIIANPAAELGRLPEYATVNLSAGADWNKFNVEVFVSNLFNTRGQISRFEECGSCGQRPYIVPITPRMIGLRIGAKY